MRNLVAGFVSLLMVVVCSSYAFANNAEKEELSSKQIKQYKNGIFEVVTEKLSDNVSYKDDFPHSLIPFHIRNDKYHSLGTAFLIDDDTFVSAAHVLSVEHLSLNSGSYSVRDTKGNVYKIATIERFSNYRDIVQFTIEKETAEYYQFKIAETYEEGDVVYTAGNAHGEGVVFRKGSLTSFTYEPVDGQWKDIRYTAPASPGNSGGPLLNLKGEVVGIITQKSSNENLNYAFPIREFLAFQKNNAEFYVHQLAEVESLQRLRYNWQFETPLPAPIEQLRDKASASYYQRFSEGRGLFEEKFSDNIFPKHTKVANYLRNQANHDMLAIIDINGNDEWSLFTTDKPRHIRVNNEQSLYFGSNDKMTGKHQFILDKPKKLELAAFVQDMKGILDTFLTSVQWKRTVADTPVYIKSYGKPAYEELHTDKYGRVWQMATWHDDYYDRALIVYCLPTPSGVACDLTETSIDWLQVLKDGYKDNLHRVMLSYDGDLGQWQEFLSLPKERLPNYLTSSSIVVAEANVKMKLGELSGKFSDLGLSEESNLYAAIEISPTTTNKLVVASYTLKPNPNEDSAFYISKYYNLHDYATDSYNDFWDKLTQQKSPYNFEVISEGKLNSKYMNLGRSHQNKKLPDINSDDVSYEAGCKVKSELSISVLNQLCDNFINGIH